MASTPTEDVLPDSIPLHWADYLVIAVYFVFVIGVGIWVSLLPGGVTDETFIFGVSLFSIGCNAVHTISHFLTWSAAVWDGWQSCRAPSPIRECHLIVLFTT
mgnify:CR=1 FL=1